MTKNAFSFSMKHRAFFRGRELEADQDFVVLSPGRGAVCECSDLEGAKRTFERLQSESKQWNHVDEDLAIFHWVDGHWVPAVSQYDMQDAELARNPNRIIHYR